MILVNLEQKSQEWYEYRKNKFNASEAGAVMGVNPYRPKNQFELAHLKYGDLEIFETERMRAGTEAEPIIREFVNKHLAFSSFEPCVGVWDKDERFSASFDGYDEALNEILEIKNSKIEFEKVKDTKKPSEHYFMQIQHQLLVSGAFLCHFAVRNPESGEIILIEVKPDKMTQISLASEWKKFEKLYKGKKLEPLEVISEDPELLNISEKLQELQLKAKEIEAQMKPLKEQAIKLANGHTTKCNGLLVYATTRKITNYQQVLSDLDIANIDDKYIKTTTSWAVRIG